MPKRKKIIVVDDNAANLAACKTILKDIYDVYTVNSVVSMLKLLENVTPDLILLDVRMPEVDGYEAARILKANSAYKEIPIIFLTAQSDAESEIEGLELGAVDYLSKPFFAPLLIKRIEMHLDLIENRIALEVASRAKGEFLSRMSHEIRTPLNALMGMLNIAMNTDDLAKITNCLKKADSVSKHLLGLINDILDMSKIEADKFELSPAEFNLEKMLIKVTDVISVRAGDKYQDIVVNLNKEVPLNLFGDELRLSQVITNLLTNAVKFTPEYGKIILNIDKIAQTDNETILRMEVADSGIGISKEQQKRLFAPFEQANSNIAQKFGGTGLGLAISKRIVELMNGTIWIDSEPGKGSKFIFTVKLKKSPDGSGYAKKFHKDEVRILFVDDSDEMRAYFTHMSESLDLQGETAADAKEALRLFQKAYDEKKPYNILFIDWQMPEVSGFELTKQIKEISAESSVVAMISVNEWNNIEKEAREAGVDNFLSKPIFPSTLIDAIHNCLGIEGESEQETKNNRYNFSDKTIMVAEDNDINREILAAILEKTGISIDFAENGKIAVSKFEANPGKYSLILMDVRMPEMDGLEATRVIRASNAERAKEIPVIAMTANVFREDIEECLAAGMNDHSGKPIDPEVLCKIIQKYINSSANRQTQTDPPDGGIAWDDALILGDEKVDRQHRQMFEMLGELVGACNDGNELEKLEEILDFLVDYTIQHFRDEEALQQRCGYPGYEKHKQLHDQFTVKVGSLVQRFKTNGSTAELFKDLNKTVATWFVEHILTEDKKIREYI